MICKKHLRMMRPGSNTIACCNVELDALLAAFKQLSGLFFERELQMTGARAKSGFPNSKAKKGGVVRTKLTKEDISALFFKHDPAYAD